MDLVTVSDLTKQYRNGVLANNGISLCIQEREVFGLLGPNGAGKTTLVRQILGLSRPTSGSIRIAGVDVVADPLAAPRLCSFQPQGNVPMDGLTPTQAISLIGRIRGLSRGDAMARTRFLLDRLDMAEWATRRTQTLSGGVGRLVGFCLAAVAPGRVVVLDEPTNDIDPRRRRLLWDEVRALADGGAAVILVTHNVLEAERAVDRVAIVDNGRVVACGSPAALKASFAGVVRLELIVDSSSGVDGMPSTFTLHERVGNRVVIDVPVADAALALSWATTLREAGAVEEFRLGPATLEDAYLGSTVHVRAEAEPLGAA